MPRRQVTPSNKQARRVYQRRVRLPVQNGAMVTRTSPNEEEMMENEESEEPAKDAVASPTEAMYVENTQLDGSPMTDRRDNNNATPQRGMNKKKARVDLTHDSDSSMSADDKIEEEICSDTDSDDSQLVSIIAPPAAIRHSTATGSPNEHPTMAETVATNTDPIQPAAINTFKTCRYAAQLLVPAHAEPVKKAGEMLQEAFREIQRQAGKQVWLAAWHSADDSLVCKKPSELPKGITVKDRDLFTRLLDNYMVITPNVEQRLFLKLHFVTQSPDALQISLPDIGQKVEALEDRFSLTINSYPNPCQSSRVSTLGWLFGSIKTMDGDMLTKIIRETLKIPPHIALGVQWRTITDKSEKKIPMAKG